MLVYDFQADVKAVNGKGLTPFDYSRKFVPDEATRMTITALLEKTSKSTKVIKNLEAKKAAEQKKQDEGTEALKLRRRLKAAIKE